MNRAEVTEFHAGGQSSRVMSTRPASVLSSFSSGHNSAEKENLCYNPISSVTQEETKLSNQEISKIQTESMRALQNPQFNSLIHTNFQHYQTPGLSDGTFLSSPFSICSQSSRIKTLIGSSTQTPLIKFKHSYEKPDSSESNPSKKVSSLFSPEFMKSQLEHTTSQILYRSKSPSSEIHNYHLESTFNRNTARFQEAQSISTNKSRCPLIRITDCNECERAQTSPGGVQQEESKVSRVMLRTHHSKASSLEELLKLLPEMNLETQTSENSVLADMVKNISGGDGSYNCTLTKFLLEASEKKRKEDRTVRLKDINKLLDSMISETKPLRETEKLAYKIYRRGGQQALQFLKKVSLLTGRGFKIVRKQSRDFDVSLVSELPCAVESDEEQRVSFFKKEQVIENAKQMSWCFEQVLASMMGGLRGVRSELEGVSQKLNEANQSFSLD